MTKLKKIILIVLGVVDLFLLAQVIGYIIWGIQMPNSVGGRNLQFMGAYILAITYALVMLLLTAVIITLVLVWRKKKKL